MRTRSTTFFDRTFPIMVVALSSITSLDIRNPHAACAGSSSHLVLVVEDHEDTRLLLKYLLTMRGFDVAEAADGEEAIDMAQRLRPCLILMDLSLPRLDGISATRRMRELTGLRTVPIIFLSGHAEPAWQVRARDAGGDDYLIKPLDTKRLYRILAQHLCVETPALA